MSEKLRPPETLLGNEAVDLLLASEHGYRAGASSAPISSLYTTASPAILQLPKIISFLLETAASHK